jgi:alpha-ribazole phosphatase
MLQEVVPGFRETDFGRFEGHTYEELKDDPAYRAWLDSAGAAAPPGGEGREAVRQRVTEAFLALAARHGPEDRAALVVHGGTIMTLLEAFEVSHRFYDWQPPNGGGWRCRWQDGALRDVEKL